MASPETTVEIVLAPTPSGRSVTIDGVDIAPHLVGPVVITADPRMMTRAEVTILGPGVPLRYICTVERVEMLDATAILDDTTGPASTHPRNANVGWEPTRAVAPSGPVRLNFENIVKTDGSKRARAALDPTAAPIGSDHV